MGTEASGRVIDPAIEQRKLQYLYEENRNREKRARAKNKFTFILQKTCKCTQCKKSMSKDFGDKQLYYGRENAPICMACIMGYKRIPKTQKIKEFNQRVSPDVRKKLSKFKKSLKKHISETKK